MNSISAAAQQAEKVCSKVCKGTPPTHYWFAGNAHHHHNITTLRMPTTQTNRQACACKIVKTHVLHVQKRACSGNASTGSKGVQREMKVNCSGRCCSKESFTLYKKAQYKSWMKRERENKGIQCQSIVLPGVCRQRAYAMRAGRYVMNNVHSIRGCYKTS